MGYMKLSYVKKQLCFLVLCCILSLLLGCKITSNPSSIQSGFVGDSKAQNEVLPIRSLKPISSEDLKMKKNSFFYDLEFHPIDIKRSLQLKEEVYDIAEKPIKQLVMKETLMSPIKLTADYKVDKSILSGFQDGKEYHLQSDTIQNKEILSRLIGVNTSLPISHRFRYMKDFHLKEGIIAIYFYPIGYKISGDTTFYMVKGKNQFHRLYCDGIYEVRVRKK